MPKPKGKASDLECAKLLVWTYWQFGGVGFDSIDVPPSNVDTELFDSIGVPPPNVNPELCRHGKKDFCARGCRFGLCTECGDAGVKGETYWSGTCANCELSDETKERNARIRSLARKLIAEEEGRGDGLPDPQDDDDGYSLLNVTENDDDAAAPVPAARGGRVKRKAQLLPGFKHAVKRGGGSAALAGRYSRNMFLAKYQQLKKKKKAGARGVPPLPRSRVAKPRVDVQVNVERGLEIKDQKFRTQRNADGSLKVCISFDVEMSQGGN
jgi:hypothetical protein